MGNPKKKSGKTTVRSQCRAAERRAKRFLGIDQRRPLPRCGHKLKNKVKRFEAAGDFSHSGNKHLCPECSCKNVAGQGTEHYGTGWCVHHDRIHAVTARRIKAETMADVIRAGEEDKLWRYDGGEFLEKLQKVADESKELIDLRENQLLVISMVQMIIDGLKTKKKPDGTPFTESSKGVEVPASDVTLLKLIPSYLNAMSSMVKIELEVKDEDYVHWDDVAIFSLGIMQVVKKHVDKETFNKIKADARNIKQPRRGRRKKTK